MTGSSRQMVHRAVKTLLNKGLIQKVGSAPKTFYKLKPAASKLEHDIGEADRKFLDENYTNRISSQLAEGD